MITIAPEDRVLAGIDFIDLFAGVGGFHYAMASFGARCVFASEWNEAAKSVYAKNHKTTVFGDITQFSESSIPKHDVLCGGFPCQAFSISGKQRGFDDIRGTMFFEIVRIAKHHRPRMLFLENVKNLAAHDGGNTLRRIREVLTDIGYKVYHKVLCASNFGVPHARERVFFVAIRNDVDVDFKFPEETNEMVTLSSVLESDDETKGLVVNTAGLDLVINESVPEPALKPIRVGKIKGGRQGERIYHPNGHAITLSSGGGGIGARTGLYLINGKVRRLAPRECARLNGLPEDFMMHESRNQCYMQFGNGVVVNVLQHILKAAIKQGVFGTPGAYNANREPEEVGQWIHVPSTFLASAQASEGSTPESSWQLEGLARSATLNAKSLRAKSWQRVWQTRPSMRLLSGLTSSASTASRGVDSYIASLRDTLASHSPSSGKSQEQATQGTCGPTSQGSSKNANHRSSSSRTCPTTSISGLTSYEENYEKWVSLLRQDYLQRLNWVHPTSGSDSSHWGTPRAGPSSCPSSDRASKFRLEDVIQEWLETATLDPRLSRFFPPERMIPRSGSKSLKWRHILSLGFWTWLMNLPQGWTDPSRGISSSEFASWETESSLLVQRTLSAYLAKESKQNSNMAFV